MDTLVRWKSHCCLPLCGCKPTAPLCLESCVHTPCASSTRHTHTLLLTALICLASQLTLNQCLDVVRVSYKHE